MDTDIDVVIRAPQRPSSAFTTVHRRFAEAEDRFSRFRPGSALSHLNRGERVLDSDLAALCRLAIEAHQLTGGLFNPMILPSLVAAGYDTTFSEAAGGSPRPSPAHDPRHCLRIDGDSVELANGALDLGGIAKGWTVDQVVEALSQDFEDLLVNAGGDMRACGSEDDQPGWAVAIERPGAPGPAWEGRLHGALATSTTLRRRWQTADGAEAHHLIDPTTGLPATSPFAQVSAWAHQTWLAEVWAKAVLVGGLRGLGLAARAAMAALTLPAAEEPG